MTLEQNSDNKEPGEIPIGPAQGPLTGAKAILWNEREFRAGWRLLIFLLFVVLLNLAENFLTRFLHLPASTQGNFTATAILIHECFGLIAVIAATSIMSQLEARPFGVYGLPRAGAFGPRFWQGVAWGLAMVTGMILLIWAFHGYSFGELALRGRAIWGYALLWTVVFLCVGFFEEFLFRGYSQFTLSSGIGFWPAAVVLSAAFGAVHLFNAGEGKVGALSVFVIGMFFCLTLRRTGSLWFAVGLHAAFDWCETFLYSVPDSGLVAPGHLLNSSFHGPMWLTGGTVGPEGSVMAFAVVGIAAVVFARVYAKQEHQQAGFSLRV
jgi:membrane protease YdiL (CAAX protease family)